MLERTFLAFTNYPGSDLLTQSSKNMFDHHNIYLAIDACMENFVWKLSVSTVKTLIFLNTCLFKINMGHTRFRD